jgi:hypothetical protein
MLRTQCKQALWLLNSDAPVINFSSGQPAAYPIVNKDHLTRLIVEGNNIRIAYNHPKCNRKWNDLVTNSVQTRSGGWYYTMGWLVRPVSMDLLAFALKFITTESSF